MAVSDRRADVYSLLLGGVDIGISIGVHDDEPRDDGITNAELAAIHEFGTADIPQRSFLRSFIDEHEDEIDAWVNEAADAVLGGEDPLGAAEVVAQRLEDGVKAQITSGIQPELRERTGGTPLVDTGRLLNSIKGKAELK